MDLKIESLPIIAIIIVISMMVYTNIVIIGDVGRVISIFPISLIILIWFAATMKVRRQEDVR